MKHLDEFSPLPGRPSRGLAAKLSVGLVFGAVFFWLAFRQASWEVIFGTLGRGNSIDNRIADFGMDERYAELGEAGVDIIATDRPRAAAAALQEAGRLADENTCGVARR